jgi:hypothetical protein
MFARVFVLMVVCALLTQCSSSPAPSRAPSRWSYQFVPGKTAVVYPNGKARLHAYAPVSVHNAIAAANQIAGKPYVWGGGHRKLYDRGYDCSGAVSYVLNHAGLLRGSTTSSGFKRFGKSGEGDWITVYAKDGHTFIEVAGLRFDTGGGGSNSSRGPHWSTSSRTLTGFRPRHPTGL